MGTSCCGVEKLRYILYLIANCTLLSISSQFDASGISSSWGAHKMVLDSLYFSVNKSGLSMCCNLLTKFCCIFWIVNFCLSWQVDFSRRTGTAILWELTVSSDPFLFTTLPPKSWSLVGTSICIATKLEMSQSTNSWHLISHWRPHRWESCTDHTHEGMNPS